MMEALKCATPTSRAVLVSLLALLACFAAQAQIPKDRKTIMARGQNLLQGAEIKLKYASRELAGAEERKEKLTLLLGQGPHVRRALRADIPPFANIAKHPLERTVLIGKVK